MNIPDGAYIAVCPQCGAEYQPHVTRCIDCGAPTRSGWSLQPGERNRESSSLLPESEDSVVVRGGDLEWAKSFGSFLEEHGIPWRLEKFERSESSKERFSYYVHVAEGDLDRALELEQEHLLLENPSIAAEFIAMPSIDQCPACSSRVSPENPECQSCGLALDGPIEDKAGSEAE